MRADYETIKGEKELCRGRQWVHCACTFLGET